MKNYVFVLLSLLIIGTACNSSKDGLKKVKTPFSGSSYESNRRFFRSVASGESINLETARSKALLTANQRLASSVQTEKKTEANLLRFLIIIKRNKVYKVSV